jgi:hypothetical protein
MVWPPPKLVTLMDESVRFATERVPAWVGLSFVGGGRAVYLGSQRMALAVVSWFAICSWAEGGVLERDCSLGVGWAVLGDGARDLRERVPWDGESLISRREGAAKAAAEEELDLSALGMRAGSLVGRDESSRVGRGHGRRQRLAPDLALRTLLSARRMLADEAYSWQPPVVPVRPFRAILWLFCSSALRVLRPGPWPSLA